MNRKAIALRAFVLTLILSTGASGQLPNDVGNLLEKGKLKEAEGLLETRLKEGPGDDNARFALGTVEFLRAVEARAQGLYRHGFRRELRGTLSLLPIPTNPKPEPLDARQLRSMIRSWIEDLKKAEATLATIKSKDVKLPLFLGRIRIDMDGDGEAKDSERLWHVFQQFNPRVSRSEEEVRQFQVVFDRGDVDWLRGYCHLLMAISEAILAHDFTELFDHSGYNLFSGARPPAPFLSRSAGGRDLAGWNDILDLIAGIHMLNLNMIEPERMKAAHGHLLSVIALSRSSWKLILAETDDDHEWLPNPKQTAAGSATRITQEMIDAWYLFLDEFEALLGGKKLAPFWRGDDRSIGINVRRVFFEPRKFDLVLWVQGVAAAPYLEKGELSQPDTWNRLNRIFQGEFLGFAFWFN